MTLGERIESGVSEVETCKPQVFTAQPGIFVPVNFRRLVS